MNASAARTPTWPALLVGGVLGLTAQACFDPLYESGQPLVDTYVVCCEAGRLTTCLCQDVNTCEAAFVACAGGSCTTALACDGTGGGTGGGAAGGGTGGAFGGGSGGGAGGGTGGGAGGGSIEDAGAGGGAGGGATGGGGGAAQAWEPCCVNGWVTSCVCAPSGCAGAGFLPCAGGRCAASTGSCG